MSAGKLYLLTTDGETPVETEDVDTWLRWTSDPANLRVARTELRDGTRVSTVFLAGNVGGAAAGAIQQAGMQAPPTALPDGRPLLFETVVIWSPAGGQPPPWMARTPTRKDALEAHRLGIAHAATTLAHRLAQPIPVHQATEPGGMLQALHQIAAAEAHPEVPLAERYRIAMGIANKAIEAAN